MRSRSFPKSFPTSHPRDPLTSITSPAKLLALPDEILLQVIKHYLAVPEPASRILITNPCSGDPAILKLTCKRLNLLTHDVAKGKTGQMTMFISSPRDFCQLLMPKSQRVQRLIFTDIGGAGGAQDNGSGVGWLETITALLDDLTKILLAAQQGGSPLLPLLKDIGIWPDTQVYLSRARAALLAGTLYDVSRHPIQSLTHALYAGLVPLCHLLNLGLTINTLNGIPDLYVSHMPPFLRIITPLKHLPSFSPRIPFEAVSQREEWTLIISPQMTADEVVKRTIRFLHGMDRRIMARSSPGLAYCARVCLEYNPDEVGLAERQDLVHLIRQGVMGLAGGYSVSTDLQGKVKISIG